MNRAKVIDPDRAMARWIASATPRSTRDGSGAGALLHHANHVVQRIGNRHAGPLKRLDLALWRAGSTGDDRASMAHALARRSRAAGDEGVQRLVEVLGNVLGRELFVRSADLADQQD